MSRTEPEKPEPDWLFPLVWPTPFSASAPFTLWYWVAVGVRGTISDIVRDIATAARACADAAPNPVGMAQAFLDGTTGVLNRLLLMPERGVLTMLSSWLEHIRYHNRLIRLQDALSGAYAAYVWAHGAYTGLGPDSLAGYLLRRFFVWLYRATKWAKFAWRLLGVENEAQLIEALVHFLRRRIRTTALVAKMFGAVILLVTVVFRIGFLVSVVVTASGAWQVLARCLPQRRPRKWVVARSADGTFVDRRRIRYET